MLNLLQSNCEEEYFKELKFKWNYFKVKYQLSECSGLEVAFLSIAQIIFQQLDWHSWLNF